MVKNLYGIQTYITVFTKARHRSQSSARLIQYTSTSAVFKIHFNVIFPPTSRSSKWSLAFRFSSQYFLRFCHLSPPKHRNINKNYMTKRKWKKQTNTGKNENDVGRAITNKRIRDFVWTLYSVNHNKWQYNHLLRAIALYLYSILVFRTRH
jgi:hypothetical protein